MHITASVFINGNESGLHADYERWLEELVPFNPGSDPANGGYLHNRTGEDNADAHHQRPTPRRPLGNTFPTTTLIGSGGSGCWGELLGSDD
ncbi:YjbQ family protein [Rubinisphaera sp. ICM_H10]|nr:YjbQ family protein [Rubinisphaera margarita]